MVKVKIKKKKKSFKEIQKHFKMEISKIIII